MGKRGRKIRRTRKYRIKESEEQKRVLTEQEIERKKELKKELRRKIREKKNNHTKWLIETTTEEMLQSDSFENSKVREKQLDAKLKQLSEELEQTQQQILLNEDKRNLLEKVDPEALEKVIEDLKEEESYFDEEIKSFKLKMRNVIIEINQIIKKEEEENKFLYVTDYDEFKVLLDEIVTSIDCPLLCSRFQDPQIAPSGMVYDKAAIDQLISRYDKDPFTRVKFQENSRRKHYFFKEIFGIIKTHAEVKNIDIYSMKISKL
ncbi:unnamed protein product [Moneuplotes crassus]|uniref:U-box domain-containing protein n=1 Tax=Euplotes crassus TaxID=5936 RepID=A0AAD2D1M6_EUPCR|nr:unnamed protein product [Moneuplotes crassus]